MPDTADQELFIFPLNTVLFPDGILAVRIFEQRYIEMTKSCLRDNQPFGVCLIREGREVGPPAVPEAIGCTAIITQWDMPQLGLFHLRARGGVRFRIVETRTAANGLISGRVRPFPPDGGRVEIDGLCRGVLELAINKVGTAGFPDPVRLDDPAWIAYRLAEILPVDMDFKQQLLELQDSGTRFERLRQILAQQGITN